MNAFLLEPFVSSAIWGGRRLIDTWGVHTDKENAAEAWVLSCHPTGESVSGGRTLSAILRDHPEYTGLQRGEFPLLVKLIDAHDKLSVQVHPTAEYCAKSGGDAQPKTECWLILDCEPGAELIIGFREDVTPEQVRRALEDGSFLEKVNRVPVRPGDFFFIPSGLLHAIGSGILLAEVQQSSDTTYRLFDYNRPGLDGKPRPLHVEEALGCLDFSAYSAAACAGEVGGAETLTLPGSELLCACPEFTVSRVKLDGAGATFPSADFFRALLILDGAGTLAQGGESLPLSKGKCVFIPAGGADYRLIGNADLLVVSA
ncbi:MAG: class I mannose-6-phosphate isomerase [Oscillospiraceae bacterium]|nr:class I mannose-6-phosphate isomerase [Oscillospiraceae bacterium]